MNLQPNDSVIQKIAAYSGRVLGIDEEVFSEFPNDQGAVGTTENIYLYGHGGTSRVDVETHDQFARLGVERLREMLAPIIPADYEGTIYLVGCTTQPLVAGLASGLASDTDQDVRVLGTPEKLEVWQGEVALRRQPKDTQEEVLRSSLDLQRPYFFKLHRLLKELKTADTQLAAATSMKQRMTGMLALMTALETLKATHQEMAKGLQILGSDELPPKVEGRRDGLQAVQRILDVLAEHASGLTALMERWLPLRTVASNFGLETETLLISQMGTHLQGASEKLNFQLDVLQLMVNTADEVKKGVPFGLELMGQPAPPALVESSSGTHSDVSESDVSESSADQSSSESSGPPWGTLIVGLGAILVLGTILWRRRH